MTIKSDSRKIQKGDIFVALRGVHGDGHQFIEDAIERGASKIIAEEGNYRIPYEIVPDTEEYLIKTLKELYRPTVENMVLIGVTGTNGKTTVAYLIYEALNKLGIKTAYIGTVGFYLEKKICAIPNTTPDIGAIYEYLLEAKEKGFTHVVLEASSQGLYYRRLEGISFDYAIFTNLTQDHLDFHHTMEQYAFEKKKLFLQLKKGGIAILNRDDSWSSFFSLAENQNVYYGKTGDFLLLNHERKNGLCTFSFQTKEGVYKTSTTLEGMYNLYNLMALITLLSLLSIDIKKVLSIVPLLSLPEGRFEKIPYRSNFIVVDYAHTPDGYEKLIQAAREMTKGHVYVVFGCRGNRDRLKRPMMTQSITQLSDYAILTTDCLNNESFDSIIEDMTKNLEAKNYEIIEDRREAILKGISLLKEDDVLLIGGRGHEQYQTCNGIKIPFHDKKVVLECIEKFKQEMS